MHLPKVDALFRSAAPYAGADAVGVVMTGMGDPCANGRFEPKAVGAVVIAQDEETSVVSGMPMEAVALSAAMKAAPLSVSLLEIPHARAQT